MIEALNLPTPQISPCIVGYRLVSYLCGELKDTETLRDGRKRALKELGRNEDEEFDDLLILRPIIIPDESCPQ